jgi:hypothetical protein
MDRYYEIRIQTTSTLLEKIMKKLILMCKINFVTLHPAQNLFIFMGTNISVAVFPFLFSLK